MKCNSTNKQCNFDWLLGTVQRRSRECLSETCQGKREETRHCNRYSTNPQTPDADAPIESQWGQWGAYGPCRQVNNTFANLLFTDDSVWLRRILILRDNQILKPICSVCVAISDDRKIRLIRFLRKFCFFFCFF